MTRVAAFGMSGAERALLTAGVGVLAARVGMPVVHAATIVGSVTGDYVLVDLDGDLVDDLKFVVPFSTAFHVQALRPGISFAYTTTFSSSSKTRGYAFRLPATNAVTAWGTWQSGPVNIFHNNAYSNSGLAMWEPAGPGYLGVKFSDGNYAWVEVASLDSGTKLAIGTWEMIYVASSGSGTDGVARAPGTPEPSVAGLALLALGAAGVLRRRRSSQ